MDLFFWRAYYPFVSQKNVEMLNIKAIVDQLGVLYRHEYENSSESARKIGIRKIYDTLEHKVSKRQIKTFVNISVRKGRTISLPFKLMPIFTTLTKLVDDNKSLRNFCKNQCLNCINYKNSKYCRELLMPSLYDCILTHQNQIRLKSQRAKEEIVDPLMNYDVICE